jgi:hypothetical protein
MHLLHIPSFLFVMEFAGFVSEAFYFKFLMSKLSYESSVFALVTHASADGVHRR